MINTVTIQILRVLRSGTTYDWAGFVHAMGYDAVTGKELLRLDLANLGAAGLVTFAGETEDDIREIRISRNWSKIQGVLGISLTELARLTGQAMIVEPYLGKPSISAAPLPDIFVAMPFDRALQPVYEDHIKKVAAELGVRAGRADDFFSTRAVMADVWEGICGARVVIADCTGRNPNVFYEIGLAHAVGKTTVLVTQRTEDVPFDLTYVRFIEYEYTPRGMQAFEQALRETLKNELLSRTRAPAIREQQQQIQRREEMAAELRRTLGEGERMVRNGLACPICHSAADIRAKGRSLFICKTCGRSFRVNEVGEPFDPLADVRPKTAT